jgi:hypothetical protein
MICKKIEIKGRKRGVYRENQTDTRDGFYGTWRGWGPVQLYILTCKLII